MLRWILLIPFACLVAMGAGVFFLGMASFASPAVAMLIGGGIESWLAYFIALGFLLFRPQGLFGDKIIERI